MPFCLRAFALFAALLLPVAANAAGLPIAKKSIAVKTKEWDISVQYPATGNAQVDAALADYARREVAEFKTSKPDFANGDSQYALDITYAVERNDGKMLGVVFTEYRNTGGAHPNSTYTTFNFVLPEGYDVTLPEILGGNAVLKALAAIVRPRLMKKLTAGPDALSDKDMVTEGTRPTDDNYAYFVWLPDRLHLYFPAYQVASYAAGPQELTVPLAALNGLIRSDWKTPTPSFDCGKAQLPVEKAVCSDRALARLDREVSSAYALHLVFASDDKAKQDYVESQREWMAGRSRACNGDGIVTCLKHSYEGRLKTLQNYGG